LDFEISNFFFVKTFLLNFFFPPLRHRAATPAMSGSLEVADDMPASADGGDAGGDAMSAAADLAKV
jgi:hypothetical protein